MSNNALIDIVIGAAVVGLLVARQMRARPVREGSAARISVILGVIGLIELSDAAKGHSVGTRAGGLDRGFFSRRRCARHCSRLFDEDLASSGRFRHEPGNGSDCRSLGGFARCAPRYGGGHRPFHKDRWSRGLQSLALPGSYSRRPTRGAPAAGRDAGGRYPLVTWPLGKTITRRPFPVE